MINHWPLLLSFRLPPAIDIGLPETVALAAVALIGYLFGHRTRRGKAAEIDAQHQRELDRASEIARQLESIAHALRQDLAGHHSQLTRFKRRLSEAQDIGDGQSWKSLCAEADLILAPTMRLAQHLSLAYDSIRQQSDALETFSQRRTDALTGVGNDRALNEKIDALLTAARRSGADFSVALISLDCRAGERADNNEPTKKSRLPELARVVQTCMRDSDFVARYGDDEFAVVMPQTKLSGAGVFGERVRKIVAERMSTTVGCGIAQYQSGDGEKSLLVRADSALYSAKAAGPNRQFVHTGHQIREHCSGGPPRSAESGRPKVSQPSTSGTMPAPAADVPVGDPFTTADPLAAN
jgi:diguanylate cyclase (GGDEF)-like protein